MSFTTTSVYGRESGHVTTIPASDGFRFGISVTDLDGKILVAKRANERFVPASNAKLLVTAAALADEEKLLALKSDLQLVLEPSASGPPTLILMGHGDPTVGIGADCKVRCLETLADAVVKYGVTEVSDIVGDDRTFADEPRPLGWGWDDLKFGHGTSISALSINDNVLVMRASPGAKSGASVTASWFGVSADFFGLLNEATTSDARTPKALRLERRIGTQIARLYGELPVGSGPVRLKLGVDDPAYLAAWYLKRALEAKGVLVSGQLRTRHRPLQYRDEPKVSDLAKQPARSQCMSDSQRSTEGIIIASLPAAPVQEIVKTINRKSQNLYAEVLLRQLGRSGGRGSSFCGVLQIEQFLEDIGIPRKAFEVADGSGLSAYNRVTPAMMTTLLRHAAATPWSEAYRSSLPISGASSGSLRYRFRGSALEGKVFAKTGTLNHVDALSGYVQASSGKMLVFSIIVNDRPFNAPSAIGWIDATLLKIAEQY
ncbi:MAG: D-alanyl-D-alanine carboxypeptidase/D-alanyl-D-alanine-endopeptidase [Pseudomonadota bacterium]